MKNKIFVSVLLALIITSVAALAIPTVKYVKINGNEYETGDNVEVERGESLEVVVKLDEENNYTETNIVAEADILGYEYSDTNQQLSDYTTPFDLDSGDVKYVTLDLKVPENADRDYYDLRVRVAGRQGESFEGRYSLHLKGLRHQIMIKDILSDDEVMAGRGIFINAKLRNVGEKDEDDITVKVSIPKLGLVEYTTIESLDADDSITTEDVVLLIPECAKPGTYEVVVEAEYDYDEIVESTKDIEVTENDQCGAGSGSNGQTTEKTIINVPQAQEAKAGETASYPIMITNMGANSKTYVISVSGAADSFAKYRIEPSNVVIVGAGQTKTVFVYLDLNENTNAGLKDFTITVKTGAETENVPLTVNILKGEQKSGMDLKTALEIGLVILLVILIIVGLIWGFNKIKGSSSEEESDEEVTQTYY